MVELRRKTGKSEEGPESQCHMKDMYDVCGGHGDCYPSESDDTKMWSWLQGLG
jgi:hypothetical protein